MKVNSIVNKKAVTEMAVYGLLATIYTSLFFFGALYPQYGIPEGSIISHRVVCKAEEKPKVDKEEVLYKSYLLEKVRGLF